MCESFSPARRKRRVGGRYVPPVIVIGRKLVECGPWIHPRGRNGTEPIMFASAGHADALPDPVVRQPEPEPLTGCGCQWDEVETCLTPNFVRCERARMVSLQR